MFPANFEYVCPENLSEAVRFLNEHREEAKVLAGGQSLIPLLKLRLAAPQYVVDIGHLDELKKIEEEDGHVRIGSLVRHVDVERSELLARVCPLLPETAAAVGDVQVRNRGTFGGSLAHADPAGDLLAAALVLEAELTARSTLGERVIRALDFFEDLLTTTLEPSEILTSVRVPVDGPRTGSAYAKMQQQASGFAIVGVASLVRLDAAGKAEEVRVGVTGVDSVPYRARAVEQKLRDSALSATEIAAAASLAAEGIEPLSDIHASSEYRREMAAVYTRRALEKALERARKR